MPSSAMTAADTVVRPVEIKAGCQKTILAADDARGKAVVIRSRPIGCQYIVRMNALWLMLSFDYTDPQRTLTLPAALAGFFYA